MKGKKEIKQLGGKREGAGRPKGEPKKAIGKRVPIKWLPHINKLIDEELKKLESGEVKPLSKKKG